MKLVKEHINKFERGLDPKDAMNIGLKQKIAQWLDTYFQNVSHATKAASYIINDDLTINIDGFFITNWTRNFPDYIQFNEINGIFIFSDPANEPFKTSLKGCPKIVNGDFRCNRSGIKNLINGPQKVYGDYLCSLNPYLESLEGLATLITGNFACNNKNGLTINDIPKETVIKENSYVEHWAKGQW